MQAGGTPDERATFYTAIHHSLLQPNVFEDVNGEYQGFDFLTHRINKGQSKYVNFSLWNTHRTAAHLQALLAPHEASDMASSLLLDAQQSDALPNWSMNNREYSVVNGYSPFPFIANLNAMGATDFDLSTMVAMIKKVSTQYMGYQGWHGWLNLNEYQRLGYVPVDKNDLGTSMTMEYGLDDYSIANSARRPATRRARPYTGTGRKTFSVYLTPKPGFCKPEKSMAASLRPSTAPRLRGTTRAVPHGISGACRAAFRGWQT